MPSIVIVGVQWGDEGKGKITDFLASEASTIVRYQGGNNAGHTILVGQEKYKLHLIPSGILYKNKICVLGNGVVVDLPGLVGELEDLKARDVDTSNLFVSSSAHLILEHHKTLDALQEDAKGNRKIGTTRRGIGPAYSDKVHRRGIRVGDLGDPEGFRDRLDIQRQAFEREAPGVELDWDAEIERQRQAYQALRSQITDTSALVNQHLDRGERVLFEGAQGTFLDLDHGTYPYVTSSTPTAGGACVGAGVGPTRIDRVIGVTKAYTTRVGGGPFVCELTDSLGDTLVERGQEFGTTTGRRRRCGWIDAVMLRYSARVNGLTDLAITKLDVLDEFDELKICTAYDTPSGRTGDFPLDDRTLEQSRPLYETHPGWKTPLGSIRDLEELPKQARSYLDRISELTGVRVSIVSVGADRSTTIIIRDPWLDV